MAEITLDGLNKVYDNGFHAVRDVSLDVAEGEFLVLLGPSGCGKSTTLRMIAGLEEISSGKLLFDGEDVTHRAARERDVGMVFQNYALYPHLTVFENIAFPLRIQKLAKTDVAARVQATSTMLGLDELLERKPKQLSGGQRQRVALGRAIVRKPRVFLFDEPLSNLDAKLRMRMRSEIIQLHRSIGVAAVYVTHDQTEAMTMGDRIAIMNGGELVQLGTPREVYDNPADRFVAGFLGSPSMNFFEGELRDGRFFSEDGDGIQLELDARSFTGAPPSGRCKVAVGIRPEALHRREAEFMSVEAAGDLHVFDAKIELQEYLGHELLLHFRTGDKQKTARSAGADEAATASENQRFYVKSTDIFVFDDSGKRM